MLKLKVGQHKYFFYIFDYFQKDTYDRIFIDIAVVKAELNKKKKVHNRFFLVYLFNLVLKSGNKNTNTYTANYKFVLNKVCY